LHDRIFIRLNKTPEGDGQIDGQTARAITAICIASNADAL